MCKLFLGWILLLSTGGPLLAEPFALPKTALGQSLAQLAEMCLKPDLKTIKTWLEKNLSKESLKIIHPDDYAKQIVRDCESSGGYDFIELRKNSPDELQVVSQGRKTKTWVVLGIISHEPSKIDGFENPPAYPPEPAMPKGMTDIQLQKQMKDASERLIQAGIYSGIVVVARGKDIVAQVSGGAADREKHIPIRLDTQFTLSSLGKMFTAVAIGQLIDQKKIRLDDKVGKFFPNLAQGPLRDQVNVEMLLSHRSGMKNDFLDKRTPDMLKKGVKRAEEFLPLFIQDTLQFAPGTDWAYSNAGFALLGAIVEKVSGLGFPEYLSQNIFKPLGMVHSHANNIPQENPNFAKPYTRESEQGFVKDWQLAERDLGSPAGGMVSSAGDLVLFADALRSGSLLKVETFAEFSKPRNPPANNYGYGVMIRDLYGETLLGHNGGFTGAYSWLTLIKGSPYTIVSLVNQDSEGLALGLVASGLVASRVKAERVKN